MKKRKVLQALIIALLFLFSFSEMALGAEDHNLMLTSAPSWTENKGMQKAIGSAVFYENSEGGFSADLEKDIVWIKEESNDQSAWYGLDNEDGMFSPGSRIWIKWVTQGKNPQEYDLWIAGLDSMNRFTMSGNSNLFQLAVIDAQGNEIIQLPARTAVYVEISDDWNSEDVSALFILDSQDEKIETNIQRINTPEGPKTVARLQLNHLGSPILLGEKQSFTASVWNNYQPVVLCVLTGVFILMIFFIVKGELKK